MAYTVDSKIGDFLKDPKGMQALGELVGELSKHPMAAIIKGMTLKQILAIPQVKNLGLTEDMVKVGLTQVNARLK
jgi:hypothetical protein